MKHIDHKGVIFRYMAQSLGLYIFVLRNNLLLSSKIIYSFLYGIIIYDNYLSTNYATINIFDEKLALADLSKGGIIMIITTYLYHKFKNYQ